MQNSAQQMYALSLDECVDLIAAVGTKRTVLMQGDMGNGKSSTLKTLHEKLPTHTPVYFDATNKDLGDMMLPSIKGADEQGFVRFMPNEVLQG